MGNGKQEPRFTRWLLFADLILIVAGLVYIHIVGHDGATVIVMLVCFFIIPTLGVGLQYYGRHRKSK